MKDIAKDEIEKFSAALWPYAEKLDVTKEKDGIVKITVSSMYEAPELSFAQLMALAEFFGTKSIDDDGRFSHGGCETCGYGSEYGFTLTVRPNDRGVPRCYRTDRSGAGNENK